ncbi:MAG: hypothetical protein M1828_002623 [Chrysothrix sp. TS-e1954]|nr:MAG: hypothetical protein M1828_002623 [Chrysothrix sp. TS-e1954]
MPPWLLVTPSSRGIGLALSRRLLRTTQLPLVATARSDLDRTREAILSPSKLEGEDDLFREGGQGVVDEGRLTVLRVDVTDESTIEAAASTCARLFPPNPKSPSPSPSTSTPTPSKATPPQPPPQPSHLHLALLTPGILHPEKSPSQLDPTTLARTFAINTIGPLLLYKHFCRFLPRKPPTTPTTNPSPLLPPTFSSPSLNPTTSIIASLSARVGSISDNHLGGWYGYRCSKAALNQAVKTFDHHLKLRSGDRAMSVGLHPGTVRTGLSSEFWGGVERGRLFSPGFAAGALVGVLGGLEVRGRGRCWDWRGGEVVP